MSTEVRFLESFFSIICPNCDAVSPGACLEMSSWQQKLQAMFSVSLDIWFFDTDDLSMILIF